MTRNTQVFLAALVAALLAGGLLGYYEVTTGTAKSQAPSTGSVTGTNASGSDTFFSCSITGIGGFELLVASDSGGAPVSGEVVNAVDHLGCNSAQQVVYLDNFTAGPGGWLTPVFPSQAEPGGSLNFTVIYQGRTYGFSAGVPPIGTSCVTLHVPSGSVTRLTTMNACG